MAFVWLFDAAGVECSDCKGSCHNCVIVWLCLVDLGELCCGKSG